MVTQCSVLRSLTILLTAAGIGIAIISPAQIATQNLFRRAQFIEYLRLINQNAYQIQQVGPGQMTIKDNRTAGQLVEFQIKCKVGPEVHKIWLNAEVQFAFSKWSEAAAIFGGLIKTDSSFCDAYFRLAQCHVARNDLRAGYEILLLAKKRFPDNPLLNLGFGQLYLLLSIPRTALYYFEKQIILHPEDPEGFLGASWAAHELNDDGKALLYLKKGRDLLTNQVIAATGRLTPVSTVTYTSRNPLGATIDYLYIFESLLYNNLNQNEKSRDAVRNLTSEDQREIASFRDYCVGMYYYNKGEKFYSQAKRNIRRAVATDLYVDPAILRELGIRADPTDFKAMVLRENYSKVSTRMRSISTPLMKKADTLFQNRYLTAAAEVYSNCLQEDSSNLTAYYRLGECYRDMSRQGEALKIYQLAHRKFPREIKFTLVLGRELLRAGRTEEAIASYRKAIWTDRKNYKAYYGACLALAHKGDFEEANEVWNAGKDLIPQFKRESYFMSGILYYSLGYYHAAIPALANSQLSRDAFSKYYLSLSYHHLGGHEDDATSSMIDAIKLGAIVSSDTVKMVGLDPAIHRSY